jgi:hypothetical protein
MFSQPKPCLRPRASGGVGPQQAWQDGLQFETPVEPILVLGQVTMGVFSKIEGMIRTRQGGLHVAVQRVDPGRAGHVGTSPARTDHFRHMDRAGPHDRRKTMESVAEHPGRGAQISRSSLTSRLFGKARDRVEARHLRVALHARLHGRDKGHFILRALSGLAPTLTPEVGIIGSVQNFSHF